MLNFEQLVTLNSHVSKKFDVLGPASFHFSTDSWSNWWGHLNYQEALSKDMIPIPAEEDREYAYKDHHFCYWASGFDDYNKIINISRKYCLNIDSVLDFGCSSGRLTRHFGILKPEIKTLGCDINNLHVEWCNKFLPSSVTTFQNTTLPSLPLFDSSLSIISCINTFTHIDTFFTSWLMELRRVLRPGGLIWMTINTNLTLQAIDEKSPLFNQVFNHPLASSLIDSDRNFVGDRLLLVDDRSRPYGSIVFYERDYLMNLCSRFFEILEFHHRGYLNHDLLVLRK